MSSEAKLNPEPEDSISFSSGERPLLDKLRSGLGWGALGLIVAGGTLVIAGMGWPLFSFHSPELLFLGDTIFKVGIVSGAAYLAITHGIPSLMRATQGHLHRHA